MDAEFPISMFSDQFYGRLLAELQDGQSLPNIPIADLGDLDIGIPPQPQNGSLHRTSNNNNNNDILPMADNTWGDNRQQYESGIKRQLEISAHHHDHHDGGGGQRGAKFMRASGGDVTHFNNTGAGLIKMNRETNLYSASSYIDRNDNGGIHNSRDFPQSVDAAMVKEGTPTKLMGLKQEGFSSARRLRNSVESYDGSTESPEGDGKIHDPQSISLESSPAAVGPGPTESCYQQVHISPATVDSTCDNEADVQSADLVGWSTDSPKYRQHHLHPDTQYTSIDLTNDKTPMTEAQLEDENVSDENGVQEKARETNNTQTFLDWAMENGLLEVHFKSDEKVSSVESVSDNAGGHSEIVQQKQVHVEDKVTKSLQKETEKSNNADLPMLHLLSCTLCSLSFRKNDHLLSHLKHYHSNEDFYPCPDCAAKLDGLQPLEDHMKVHSLISNISTDDAQSPGIIHDGYFGCEICQAVFQSEDTLAEHQSTYHRPEKWASIHSDISSTHNLSQNSEDFLNSNKPVYPESNMDECEFVTVSKAAEGSYICSTNNNNLNDQAHKMTEHNLSTNAANSTSSTEIISTDTHIYSEQDFLHLNFKREYSEENQEKEMLICEGLDLKARSDNINSEGNDFQRETSTGKNYLEFTPTDNATSAFPDSYTPQADTVSTTENKETRESTKQSDNFDQNLCNESADVSSGEESVNVKNQFHGNLNGSQQKSVEILSEQKNNSKHDDKKPVLLCNSETIVSKVDISCPSVVAVTERPENVVASAEENNKESYELQHGIVQTKSSNGKGLHVNYDTTAEDKVASDITEETIVKSTLDRCKGLTSFSETTFSSETRTDVNTNEAGSDPDEKLNTTTLEPIKTVETSDSIYPKNTPEATLVATEESKASPSLVQNWVQLTESKSVIPPHMPNYTTYKCLTCAISFMSEDVLKRHCEAHIKSKKRLKKKRSKSKKTKRKKIGNVGVLVNPSENRDVFKDEANVKEALNKTRPVIVGYDESDEDEEAAKIVGDVQHIKIENAVDGSLKLLQEYL